MLEADDEVRSLPTKDVYSLSTSALATMHSLSYSTFGLPKGTSMAGMPGHSYLSRTIKKTFISIEHYRLQRSHGKPLTPHHRSPGLSNCFVPLARPNYTPPSISSPLNNPFEQVRLRVSNSSLLRVSAAEVSLHTPAIVLRSSSPLTAATAGMGGTATASSNGDGRDPASLQQPPPMTGRQDPGIRGPGPTAAAELSLDDSGDVAVAASGSIGMETPGAFVQLSGRRSRGDGLAAGGRDDGEGLDRGGLLVAEAGDVRIIASAGVSVVATDGADARAWAEEGASNGTAAAGGRLEVKQLQCRPYVLLVFGLIQQKDGSRLPRSEDRCTWQSRAVVPFMGSFPER